MKEVLELVSGLLDNAEQGAPLKVSVVHGDDISPPIGMSADDMAASLMVDKKPLAEKNTEELLGG